MNSLTKAALALFFMLMGGTYAYSQVPICNDECPEIPWVDAHPITFQIPGTNCIIHISPVLMRSGNCDGVEIYEFEFHNFRVYPADCGASDQSIFGAIHSQLIIQAKTKFNIVSSPFELTIISPSCWTIAENYLFPNDSNGPCRYFSHCNIQPQPCCKTRYLVDWTKNVGHTEVPRLTKFTQPPNKDCTFGATSPCVYTCDYSAQTGCCLDFVYKRMEWPRIGVYESQSTELSGNLAVNKDKDQYTFVYNGDVTGDLSLMIYDINGKIVKEGKFSKNGNYSEFILNDFNALNGVYFYRVVNANSSLGEGKIIIY